MSSYDPEPERTAGWPHSPQLDGPMRSRERAALDIAVKALSELQVWNRRQRDRPIGGTADKALAYIAALVPDAVKP